MNDILTIALFFVFALIGAAVVYLVMRLRQHTPPPPAAEEALPETDGSVEVLRVWRTAASQLRLGMDGQKLETAEALSPEQRRRLVKLVIDLRPWLEGAPELSAPRSAAAPAAVPSLPAAPAPAAAKKPAEAKPAPAVLKSLIEQINDVLQVKLATTTFQGQDIHLSDGPLGAIIVTVGLNKYDGIDAVPDPEIKALIKQSVADWEKSSAK